jgi:hypothetical protein
MTDSQQIEHGQGKGHPGTDPFESPIHHAPQTTVLLGTAKGGFDQLAFAQTDGVTRMTRGASIQRRPTTAARQRGGKDRIRRWRPAIEGVLRSLRRACDGVA